MYAGYTAHVYLAPDDAAAAKGQSWDDDEKAQHFLELIGRANSDSERCFRMRAKEIVEERWQAITAIATRLLEREEIDSEEAELIVGAATGVQGASEDLKKYREMKEFVESESATRPKA